MTLSLTLFSIAAGVALGVEVGWWVCTFHHKALRVDRDLHEQDSHVRKDAAWLLAGRMDRWIDNPGLAARTLDRANRLRTGRYRPRFGARHWTPGWGQR
jgi:hypothetical protein